VTHLGRGIDELELDVFQVLSLGCWHQGLSQDQVSLFGTDAAALEHDVVISDDTVVREATHWGNVLLGQIVFSGSVVGNIVFSTLAQSVDSLVLLSSMVVSRLTGSWDGVLDFGRMPGSDTTDLSETSMSLSWQLSDTISLGDAGVSLTLGDTDDIENFTLGEDLIGLDLLLEESFAEINLFLDGSTVDLDFHNMGLLGSEVLLKMDLSVADGSDGCAVFDDSSLVSNMVGLCRRIW